jgi:transposase-like protein
MGGRAHNIRSTASHPAAGYEKPEDLLGEDGLFKQLKKALLERALGAELTHRLGYEKGDGADCGTGNNRNGTSAKTDRGWIGRDRCAAR